MKIREIVWYLAVVGGISLGVGTFAGVLLLNDTKTPALKSLPSVPQAEALFEPLTPTETVETDVIIIKDGDPVAFEQAFQILGPADLKKEVKAADAVVKTASCSVYRDNLPKDERTLSVELTKCTFEETSVNEAIARLVAPPLPEPKA